MGTIQLHELLPSLFATSVKDAFVVITSAALVVHFIFHRWEPLNIAIVSSLLVLLPALASSLMAAHYGMVKGVALGFALFYTVLVISITLYRISPAHPLARYPGPFPARLSKIWHVWKVSDGTQHLYLQRLHERYGDVVRVGPNELSVRDVSWIPPVLGAQGMPKGPMFEGRHLWPKTPSIIGFREPQDHQRRRRPWNRAFNTSSLKEFVPIIQNRVQQLVEALGARQGQSVDLAQWIGFFTYDFMGDMAYGGWTEMIREGADHSGLWACLKSGLKAAFVYEHLPWLSYYTRHLPGFGKDVKMMRAMGMAQTEKRYHRGSSSKDLFYFLGNEDGKEAVSPPKHVVISDGVTALVAGSDTTSTVLSSTFYLLLRHPEVYSRLQAEVDKFYPPGEDSLNPVHLPDMDYLSAVIQETMRLFPAVPSGSQRAPEKGKGGRMIGDNYIPEGTQMRIHFWSVHRDARNFSHPDTFWPERWLIAEGLQEHTGPFVHNPNAWIPFSFGPSNCVGKNLAMEEMRELLCHFVQKLRVRVPEGVDITEYERQMEDRFVFSIGHLPVVIERRD
ncbi:hypothetical protein PHLGIDRAFT_68457 [Phlebiopsis gigantea 11061_1 CR5-6]|uniref:Cytochrome P450 n=1 Tax=Phlebiopsis gigantea (strain 11061_1 CR5-6) TaxID=745531 RepID=A0A0C3SCM1_PHLG1|nr:hypothetical protein PHLGIDRAFT_68457 [Phlebiopsis gigantea 11061_1 CR5-6]